MDSKSIPNKTNTKVTLVKDYMYKTVTVKGKKFKQDYNNPKIFYIHEK